MLGAIAGGIAQAFYRKIPKRLVDSVIKKLPPDLLEILLRFNETFACEF